MERLKKAFDASPALPRQEARDRAIEAALAAFDARPAHVHGEARQGTALPDRLRIAAIAALNLVTGKRPMRMSHVLAGGASLAVLTLAVMTAANLQMFQRSDWRAVPAAIDHERAKGAADAVASKAAADVPAALVPPAPPPAPRPAPMPSRQLAAEATARAPSVPALAQESFAGGLAAMPAEPQPGAGYRDQGRDRFEAYDANPVKVAAEEPVSTFSIDVDTASYSFVRAALENGVLPQPDAVRVEELVNYFPYDYPGPERADVPFKASVTVMPTPWNAGTKLVHIGIKGFDIAPAERPRANLVFLIDTSGSMQEPNKLPLLVNAMKLLVGSLAPDDTVAIVTYAGSAGTALEPTRAAEKRKIEAALEGLAAGGSTAGAEGIRQAYRLAAQNLDQSGVNRVILATDGDFNVGITDPGELEGFVERERESGILLSVLGFGRGNYNDQLMQRLAQNGNGAAAYIDTLGEARKVLVDEAASTLFPIAKDVKIQVEFNPAAVSEYRLIGYETRLLNREDFNNDKVDAGDIGSGHTVTALYEITPAGSGARLVEGLRYGEAAPAAGGRPDEYGFLKLRYKLPSGDESRLIETPITRDAEIGAEGGGMLGREARFAAAVAGFGELLRGGRHTGDFGYGDVIALANANRGEDPFGYRSAFVGLARLAQSAATLEPLRQP